MPSYTPTAEGADDDVDDVVTPDDVIRRSTEKPAPYDVGVYDGMTSSDRDVKFHMSPIGEPTFVDSVVC